MAYTATVSTLRGGYYMLEISGAGTGELVLSAEAPIEIRYECDDLFKPLKMSGCTVKVMTQEPMLDLYTGELNKISLKVWRATYSGGTYTKGSLIWCGFLSPNIYSSPYDNTYDELSLEFVDVLSAMSSVQYTRKASGQWRAFNTFMTEAVTKLGMSVTYDLSYSGGLTQTQLNQLGVMERNFVDETDDDDNSSNYQDILSHICRYLNVQAVCYGDKIYLVDTMSAQSSVAITKDQIAESGMTVSLGEMYNRVTVVENTNPIDEMLYQNVLDDNVQESCMLETLESEYYDDELECYKVPVGKDKYYDLRALYYPKSDSGWSVKVGGDILLGVADSTKALADNSLHDGHNQKIEKGSCVLFDTNYEYGKPPTKLSFKKKVLFYCDTTSLKVMPTRPTSTRHYDGIQNEVFLQYAKTNHAIVMRQGYIVLSLKYMYLPRPMTEYEKAQEKANAIAAKTWRQWAPSTLDSSGKDGIRMQLKVGSKYWNGSAWTTTESWFTAYHTWKGTDQLFNTEVELDNTNTYKLRLSEDISGLAIPVGDNSLFGNVTLKICPPSCFGWSAFYWGSYGGGLLGAVGCVELTDFKLAYCTQLADESGAVLDLESDNKDITITGTAYYKNILDMDDIEFQVNTWSEKENSYSYVIQNVSGDMSYYLPTTKPEKKLIGRLLNYYGKPMLQFNCKVKNTSDNVKPWSNATVSSFAGKKFAVCGVTYDLIAEAANVELKQID